MDKNEQREIALEEISKGIYEAIQKGVGFDIVSLALYEMDKSTAWKFGFDDGTIKGIREAAEENGENDIKEYGSEEARKW